MLAPVYEGGKDPAAVKRGASQLADTPAELSRVFMA